MPAPLLLQLTDTEISELRQARRSAHGRIPERAKYVLLNAVNGLTSYAIATREQRDVRTVRHWLMAYKAEGIKGLDEHYNGGRPRTSRATAGELLPEILQQTPQEVGFKAELWTVSLLTKACRKKLDGEISRRTVRRALKDIGWSYKRARLTVPEHAPSSEEKSLSPS